MSLANHLYVILFPSSALVGSHLEPFEFAKHFISGSSQYGSGKLIFAEVDASFRNSYFKIDEMLKKLVPHEDGSPRATKYISNYRVLEHIDFDALKNLYISTPEGYTLEIEPGNFDGHHQQEPVRVYAEISPVSMLLLSDYNFLEFSRTMTNPDSFIGAPQLFYTQIEFEVEDFLKAIEANPLVQTPIPNIHPAILKRAILELRTNPDKHTKGLAQENPLGKISFRKIRHGFMFASQTKSKYYPLLSLQEIEKKNYKFSKFM